jgi:protoporphyrinogen oxidase
MRTPLVVLGAGPAGLGAALQLARRGTFDVTVLERGEGVGGNAGSFELEGFRADFGSHRLHPACAPSILADIRSLLGADLLERRRHGRIRLGSRWLHFPLKPVDLILHAPPPFVLGVIADRVRARDSRGEEGKESFASVLERGLGPTIAREFYFPFAEKTWGLAATELDAEQARRRVSAGSLGKMVGRILSALPGLRRARGGSFFYPRCGYGQISEAYRQAAVEAGAAIELGVEVVGLEVGDERVAAVLTRRNGQEARRPARQVLSTIPLPALVRAVIPAAPPDVLAAAGALDYRAMILVYLVLETERFTKYDAHYFPGREVAITRLSEPKNYGLAGPPGLTLLCAELPCSPDDEAWRMNDSELADLVREALARVGLPIRVPVRRALTRRLRHAYPIYRRGYRRHFDRLDEWVSGIDGIVSLGRQGLFAHDNTHHALAMAYAAAACLDDEGELQRQRWWEHRRAFESHVVED